MRVAQIHNAYRWRGGEDTIVETEADLLESAGHQVARLRTANPEGRAGALVALAAAPANPLASRRVVDQAVRFGADVAHVHNTWFATTMDVFHRLAAAGVPAVMTIQNYRLVCANGQLFRDGHTCRDCVGTSPWAGVTHRCYRGSLPESSAAAAAIALSRQRGTYARIGRFLAPSVFVKGVLVEAGFEPDRITVRPNCVGDPGPRPHPPSASRRLLYAGRLSPEKGVATLLEGWRASGLAGRGFELHVVGDGPLAAELQGRPAPGVVHVGWLDGADLQAAMAGSRALLFPSEWYENFGRVIIEAMATGLPVLASDIATPAEVVGAQGGGWLVPPGQADAWGEALAGLADDERVDAGGRAARALYEQRYTLARGLAALETVYEEVVAAGVT